MGRVRSAAGACGAGKGALPLECMLCHHRCSKALQVFFRTRFRFLHAGREAGIRHSAGGACNQRSRARAPCGAARAGRRRGRAGLRWRAWRCRHSWVNRSKAWHRPWLRAARQARGSAACAAPADLARQRGALRAHAPGCQGSASCAAGGPQVHRCTGMARGVLG